jgi:hypothetical protein
MDLEQLTYGCEQLALKVSALICKHLERAKNSFTVAEAVTSAVWDGRGTHSTHLVNWSTITKT